MAGDERRRAAEARREQALADLDALDEQLLSGEIDDETAERLTLRYAADLSDALAELDDGDDDHGDRAPGVVVDHPDAPDAERDAAGDRGRPRRPSVDDDDAPARMRSRRVHPGEGDADRPRRWPVVVGTLVILVVVAVVVALSARERGAGEALTGDVPGGAEATPTTRDLATVTNEELAAVVEANPNIVPMRLALVERLLRDGELAEAQVQAEEAAVRATLSGDRSRALRYLGWSTALLGRPQQGEALVIESLALEPANPNALYFLGRIRLELLGDPAGALEPLEQLAALDAEAAEGGAEQAALVEELLAAARAELDDPGPATTVTP